MWPTSFFYRFFTDGGGENEYSEPTTAQWRTGEVTGRPSENRNAKEFCLWSNERKVRKEDRDGAAPEPLVHSVQVETWRGAEMKEARVGPVWMGLI